MLQRFGLLLLPVLFAVVLTACDDDADGKGDFILATTTSTQDSGLLDVLLPLFEERSGWQAKPIAVGSGQAMEMGRNGDADVLLVHSPAAEETFMEEGFGAQRVLVMHNDFILVGPESDPAGVADTASAVDALTAIYDAGAPFISRGDDSGTHALELKLWGAAELDPAGEDWYQESGQGMGATIQIASQKDAYTIADRATYLAQGEDLGLTVLNEGDSAYFNIYHVITLNPEKNDGINVEAGDAFLQFLVSEEAQAVIEDFGVAKYGQPLFVPDAGKSLADLGVR
jgi:tungstate transport system substrate-binding protein